MHALAVQRAIATAQRDNAAFLKSAPAPAATGKSYRVSTNDVVLGLRAGEKLMLVDDQDSKTGNFVTAIDALLRKARTALGEGAESSISTAIGNTNASLTLTRDVDGVITIVYKERPSATAVQVDPIGVLKWRV